MSRSLRSAGLLATAVFTLATIACAVVGAFLFLGVGADNDPYLNPPSLFEPYPAERPGDVAEDETLVRLLEGNPTSLNPVFMSSREDFYFADLLYDTLFDFDANLKWKVNTTMVESFEESADHLRYTVRLRPGLKFHDGSPLTAHDVAFTWRVIMDPRVPVVALRPGRDQLDDVRAIDDLTVEFLHKRPLATNCWNVSFQILPRHLFGNEAEREKDPSLSKSDYYVRLGRSGVVGNGPYRMVEWVSDDRVVLERWDGFHGPKPHFRRQILKVQRDRKGAYLLFTRGEVDEMRLEVDQFVSETASEDFRRVGVKVAAPQWAYGFITWNMDGSNPFFTDRRVRRALAQAVDIPRMLRTYFHGLYEQCSGLFHPGSWMYNPEVKPLAYDPKEAARLLDEAGWLLSDDDGWRYKAFDGRPVKFSFEVLMPKESTESPRVVAYVSEELKRVGIEMKPRSLEWVTLQAQQRAHAFQASTSAWGTSADPDISRNIWASDQYAKGRNYGAYKNPRVDELFDRAREELDVSRRAEHYREIQKLIYEDQPYLFLYYRANLWAFHKRLRGVTLSPARGVFNFDPSFKSWWVHKNDRLR